jgi:hypothetical protein
MTFFQKDCLFLLVSLPCFYFFVFSNHGLLVLPFVEGGGG